MKKSIRKGLFICIIVLAVLVIIGGALLYLNSAYDSDNNAYVTFAVEEGDTTDSIATRLEEESLIKSATKYKIISKLYRYDGNYKTGSYSISPSMTCSEIGEVLISGVSQGQLITIPEGYTIDDVAATLEEAGVTTAESFLETAQSGDFSSFSFLDEAQTGENHLEGFLFPNTYMFTEDMDDTMIITTMLSEYENAIPDDMEERAEELGYSSYEILIIASIIEKEAQADEDRAYVTSVIYNRLEIDMPLQMCSSIQYILGYAKANLTTADTQIESPYNTYLNAGLPPGPLCSPGLESIEAALNPADTDYLYFVLSEDLDGTHNFSSNAEDFEEDRQAYYAALEAAEE